MLLLTEFFIINFFLVADLFLFFVFFECILLPMYLLIGIWGSNLRKIYASYQFFFFTFFGSIFMFLSVVLIYNLYGTTDFLLIQIYLNKLTGIFKLLVCIFFMIAFFIKIPVVPFHFWLPEAHVEAPTSGSVILAGLLLKLGAYGLIRFLLPLFSDIIVFLNPVLVTICIYSIIYISFIILRQLDLKRIIAYSSIIHMNFILLGLVILNKNTIIGGIFLLISHGIVSSALFICIGFLYERYHTRVLLYYKGISVVMPIYSIFFFIFMLANASLPGTSNFTGEFLVILGIFEFNNFLVFFLLLGLFYSALINF
jgi:proton-translocating NADH-quinone oxidoreductase chain M